MMGAMLSETNLWAVLLFQGTGCLAAGLALSYVLGRRAARAHQMLLVALLAAVLTPGLYLLVKHFELGVLTAPTPVRQTVASLAEPADVAVVADATSAGPLLTASPGDGPAVEPSAPPATRAIREATARNVPWIGIFLICWTVASIGSLGHLVLRFALGLRLLGRSEALPSEHLGRAVEEARTKLGIAEAVRVRSSEKVRSPIIWCWARRPVLLVQKCPTRCEGVTDWVGVFCHELAHWKRRDHLSGLLAELLTAALPWNPLAWWVKRRLMVLSEQACDDWVVAGGQIGVEYAEALLDLAPENQLAFVPTVVGKEKAMKERIRRIVKDRCGNPRIGTQWMLTVSALALLAAVSVAFAQRRPAPREEFREQQEMRELELAGRRNVLSRMLDQLTAQAHETEAALREGGARGEEGHVLRAELEALHQHIKLVERQLQSLDRREPERLGAEETERRRTREADFEGELEELRQHREEMAKRAEQIEQELEGLSDDQDEEARDLQAELREIRENMKDVQKATAVMEDRRATGRGLSEMDPRERPRSETERAREQVQKARERAMQAEAKKRELMLHRDELRRKMAQMEHELQQREQRGQGDTDEAHELRNALQRMREEMRKIEASERAARERSRSTRRARDVEVDSLYGTASTSTRGRSRATSSSPRNTTAGGTAPARARSRATRRARDEEADSLYAQAPAREEVLKQIRETEDRLKSLEEKDGPAAERLRSALEQLHRRREDLERPSQPPERRPAGRELEREVEELRGKVNGMHEEMQQMRKMLQQLLERSERAPDLLPEKVQEMQQY